MLYLSPYIGAGTRLDQFRPQAADGFPAWGAVDLRPDARVQAGFALLWLDSTADFPGLIKLGVDPAEPAASATKTALNNQLGLSLTSATMEDVVSDLLCVPGKAWRGVMANRFGQKEVFIGGRRWAFKQVAVPKLGEIIDPSDDFNRADETPIAGNWTTGFSTWTSLRLLSNELAGPVSTSDALAYYNAFTPQNDQFSQIEAGSALGINDWGPAVRCDTAAMSCYWFAVVNADWRCNKFVSGTFSTVEALTSGSNFVATDVAYCSVAGSTITCKKNGVEATGSPSTDTSLGSGRVGVFIFESAHRLDNFQGGDGTGEAINEARRESRIPNSRLLLRSRPFTGERGRLAGSGNPLREIRYQHADTTVADTPLLVDDLTVGLSAENVDLVQANTLVVQDATVGLVADNVALVQQNTLVVADATIALASDNVALTQQNTLAVQDATVALASDNVALTQQNTLAVQDATVALAADNVDLTQANTLAVQDATVALASDNVTISPDTGDTLLVVQDSTVALTTDPVALTQQNTLEVQDATIALASDNVVLTQANTLVVQDATIGSVFDNVTLSVDGAPVVEPPVNPGGGSGRATFGGRIQHRELEPAEAELHVQLRLIASARAQTVPEVARTGVSIPPARPRPVEEAREFRSFAKMRTRLRVTAKATAEVTTTARAHAQFEFQALAFADTEWENGDAEIMAAIMLLEEDLVGA